MPANASALKNMVLFFIESELSSNGRLRLEFRMLLNMMKAQVDSVEPQSNDMSKFL